MSWNSHVEYALASYKAQYPDSPIAYLWLGGPEGGMWGEAGACDAEKKVDPTTILSQKKAPTDGVKFGNTKYFFLRSPEDKFFGYNRSGNSVAVYQGTTYTAVAFGGEGTKVEHCITCLTKLKDYLSTINVN